jgi:hypothetical protein
VRRTYTLIPYGPVGNLVHSEGNIGSVGVGKYHTVSIVTIPASSLPLPFSPTSPPAIWIMRSVQP